MSVSVVLVGVCSEGEEGMSEYTCWHPYKRLIQLVITPPGHGDI